MDKQKGKWIILVSLILGTVVFIGGFVVWRTNNFSGISRQKTLVLDNDAGGTGTGQPEELLPDSDEQNPLSQLAEEPTQENNQDTLKSAFKFAVIGDTQLYKPENKDGGFQLAAENIQGKKVEFVMTEGDLLSSCGDSCASKLAEWQRILGPLAEKTYELMGNHDRTGKNDSDNAWQNSFSLPGNGPEGYAELAYSFDFRNTHVVVLNSEKPKEHMINETQRAWLEADLSASLAENKFVFFHEPAYPVSSKIGSSLDAEPTDRDALWNILVRHNVTAVFNGHEHIHSRRKIGHIYQFVFGNTDSFDHDLPKPGVAEYSFQGKNFGVVAVDGKKITVELFSVDGRLINSFQFGG